MRNQIKCPYCPRVFQNDAKDGYAIGRLKANLANHMKGSHPEHYQPKVKPEAQKEAETPEPAKRPYNRKPRALARPNFCPQCGCNMQAVGVAMERF